MLKEYVNLTYLCVFLYAEDFGGKLFKQVILVSVGADAFAAGVKLAYAGDYAQGLSGIVAAHCGAHVAKLVGGFHPQGFHQRPLVGGAGVVGDKHVGKQVEMREVMGVVGFFLGFDLK